MRGPVFVLLFVFCLVLHFTNNQVYFYRARLTIQAQKSFKQKSPLICYVCHQTIYLRGRVVVVGHPINIC